jgi:membrane dipeptidase
MPTSRPRLTRRGALTHLLGAAGVATAGASALWRAAGAAAEEPKRLTDLGMSLSGAQRAAGEAFLGHHVSVDVHSHAGRFFLEGLPRDAAAARALGPVFTDQALEELNAGHVSAAVFAAVADMRVLEISAQGVHATRDFAAGEAYADYQRQIAQLKLILARDSSRAAFSPEDIRRAARRGRTAAVFGVEGADFIEDQPQRVAAAFADGVRVITLVHYHVNQIGDIQTEPAVHQGLTPLGADIVRAMNASGILIDLAHATLEVTREVVQISQAPVMISHTNLASETASHPRLITPEHARLVTERGGLIGSVPWGVAQNSLADYVDSLLRLSATVGVAHVAIGTDMDATIRPVLKNYRDWSLLPAALLARGMHESEVAKIMGENFLRVFGAALSRRTAHAR